MPAGYRKPKAPRPFNTGKCTRTGKIRFESEADARADAKRFRKKYGAKLQQYLCEFCDGWHNGHDKTRVMVQHGKRPPREYTGHKDRNGTPINVGDHVKWIRDVTYFKSGPKAGQVKQEAAEFVAGRVVKLDLEDYPYWAQDLKAKQDDEDWFSRLPPGLNFISMLDYIEVIPPVDKRLNKGRS